ncbi:MULTISPECIES: hypothetical protein [unclassified Acinetobacter]|uniref:hypothetical protein n=1 Tax=unclassified Acinetobacter TaxID=196816 RepID=UPI0015D3A603|nr:MULTISPECIES: hypothetical protein [unclassified Acinetobacter]
MKNLFFCLILAHISTAALADKYSHSWINIPTNNYNFNSGNQQIANGLNQIIEAFSNSNKNDSQPVDYTNTGSFTYGSDGSSYYNTGDRAYGNNGNTYYQVDDNSGYDSNGSTYERVSDYIYVKHPDGSSAICYATDVVTQCR